MVKLLVFFLSGKTVQSALLPTVHKGSCVSTSVLFGITRFPNSCPSDNKVTHKRLL